MEKKEPNNTPSENGGMGLPGGYFDRSESSIRNRISWLEEHASFPLLVNYRHAGVFVCPENYFVQAEAAAETLPYANLSLLKGQFPFVVPFNYFETSKNAGLRSGNSATPSSGPENKNKFTVPEGYFEKERELLISKIQAPREKVIVLWAKRAVLAVAAVLSIVLGVSLYNFYVEVPAAEDCGTIACLDKKELLQTNSLDALDDEDLLELVQPERLEKSLRGPAEDKSGADSGSTEISQEDLLDS